MKSGTSFLNLNIRNILATAKKKKKIIISATFICNNSGISTFISAPPTESVKINIKKNKISNIIGISILFKLAIIGYEEKRIIIKII